MRRIVGYVLVSGTNAGVPHLVVTAYDTDLAIEAVRELRPTAALMQKLGRRISSVMTDQDGKFILETADLDFPGNEPRPNLTVVVFAPEDIRDSQHPYPDPPEDRVLYMSVIPRADAGAQEAFVIRIAQSQADKYQVDTYANRLASELESPWKLRDLLNDRLAGRYKAERQRVEAARAIAKEKTKDLSGVPLFLRANPLLVIGTARLSENVVGRDKKPITRLEALQLKTVGDGLGRMAAAKSRPTMRLRLAKEDLADLGLKVTKGELAGRVTSEQLADKLRSLSRGLDLIRTRGMENPTPAALEAKYLGSAAIKPKNPE